VGAGVVGAEICRSPTEHMKTVVDRDLA
jgi:hypothetical protein